MIMRHGQAENFREPDHTRALTKFGVAQSEEVGKWLAGSTIQTSSTNTLSKVELALVSPYLRTQQTLRSVGRHIAIDRQVTIDAITPTGNASQCADLIHGYATDNYNSEQPAPESILVVTHMPLVSLLADKVCVEFNARIFETADTLLCDYDVDKGIATQIDFYQGM